MNMHVCSTHPGIHLFVKTIYINSSNYLRCFVSLYTCSPWIKCHFINNVFNFSYGSLSNLNSTSEKLLYKMSHHTSDKALYYPLYRDGPVFHASQLDFSWKDPLTVLQCSFIPWQPF